MDTNDVAVKETEEFSRVVTQIIVADIDWDAPTGMDLPDEVIIDINENNNYLLEDIDGYAEELADYLSDTYDYCVRGFSATCIYAEEEQA